MAKTHYNGEIRGVRMVKMHYNDDRGFDYEPPWLSLLDIIFRYGCAVFAKMASSTGSNGTTQEEHIHEQQFFRARSQ